MKKIFALLFMTSFLVVSCSDDGEQGPQGPPGQDAPLPAIFEIEADFGYDSEGQLWSTDFIAFEDNTPFEVFETDVVLIYRLNSTAELEDGSQADEWSLLPQNFFTDQGTIQYVYNHTFVDTQIFIDGNYDLNNLEDGFTQDQIFRIAIIPADVYESANFNENNLDEVMQELNIQQSDIKN